MHIISDFIKHHFYFYHNNAIKLEKFYFQMMSSMRKFRMHIPKYFTIKHIKKKYLEINLNNSTQNNQLIITSYRINNNTFFHYELIEFNNLFNKLKKITIDIFKDTWYPTGILSTINTFHPQLQLATIYANENLIDDVIILNKDKRIARTTLGDIFIIKNNKIIYVYENEGYSNQTLSQLVIFFLQQQKLELIQKQISVSEIQMADEIFIISQLQGIISVGKIKNTVLSNKKIKILFSCFNNYLFNQ